MDIEALIKYRAVGYNKITNAQLHKAWKIMMGTTPKNNCGECFRRNTWKKLCKIVIEEQRKNEKN